MSYSSALQLSSSNRACSDQRILTAAGEIDLATAPHLQQALFELIDSGHHRLILDLRNVSFCDTSGLTTVIKARRRIDANYTDGHLHIICAGPAKRVFQLTGFETIFTIYTELDTVPDDWSGAATKVNKAVALNPPRHQVWFSVNMIASALKVPVEDIRISAELCLDRSAYDPDLDMITGHGRIQLRDQYSLGIN